MATPALGKKAVQSWARNRVKQAGKVQQPGSADDEQDPRKRAAAAKQQVDDEEAAMGAGAAGEADADVGDGDVAEDDPEPGQMLATTEPDDPMNMIGPDDEEDPAAQMDAEHAAEIEKKLGPLAEVLTVRAAELEDLAEQVDGDLLAEEVDQETARSAQTDFPEDLRRDAVTRLSAMSDEEILTFCEQLEAKGKVENAALLAGYLKAIATSTVGDDSDEEDAVEDPEEADDEADPAGGQDPAASKGKPPFPPKKPGAKPDDKGKPPFPPKKKPGGKPPFPPKAKK